MKRIITALVFLSLLFTIQSCFFETENNKISVNQFVKQLKNGTYDNFEYQDGKKLWTILPQFSKQDAYQLILAAEDTTLICPINHVPINPVSSAFPGRVIDKKLHIMLGEYLLWCAEGIIKDNEFPSLNPILYKQVGNERKNNLSGKEILKVRKLYIDWWKEYGNKANPTTYPLDKTIYNWQ